MSQASQELDLTSTTLNDLRSSRQNLHSAAAFIPINPMHNTKGETITLDIFCDQINTQQIKSLINYISPDLYSETFPEAESGVSLLSPPNNTSSSKRCKEQAEYKNGMNTRIKKVLKFLEKTSKMKAEKRSEYIKQNLHLLIDTMIVLNALAQQIENRSYGLEPGIEILNRGLISHTVIFLFTFIAIMQIVPILWKWNQNNQQNHERSNTASRLSDQYKTPSVKGASNTPSDWTENYSDITSVTTSFIPSLTALCAIINDLYNQWFYGNRTKVLENALSHVDDQDYSQMEKGSNAVYAAARNAISDIKNFISDFGYNEVREKITELQDNKLANFLMETLDSIEKDAHYKNLSGNPARGLVPISNLGRTMSVGRQLKDTVISPQ